MPSIHFLLCWVRNNKIFSFFLLTLYFLSNLTYASYNIDKIRLVLSQQQLIDTLKLSNTTTDMPVNLQIQVLRWTQNNGNDVYQNTKDLIVSPPQCRIPIDKTQVVRVGWRTPMPIMQELAYRMIISDLTPYTQPANSILIKMKVNMPVFIEPDKLIIQTQWQLKRAGGNHINVVITNTGNIHIQVTKLTLTNANNEVIASQPTQFYLLPNQSKQGVLTVNKSPGSSVTIAAETDNGIQKATVNIQ